MKPLSPEEFAAAVMRDGTELECDCYNSCKRCGGFKDFCCEDARPCDDRVCEDCQPACSDCPDRKQCCCYTCDRCDSWDIYAHIGPDGQLLPAMYGAVANISAGLRLSMKDSDDLMNGKLDDMEKDIIMSDLYPKYIEALQELDD